MNRKDNPAKRRTANNLHSSIQRVALGSLYLGLSAALLSASFFAPLIGEINATGGIAPGATISTTTLPELSVEPKLDS